MFRLVLVGVILVFSALQMPGEQEPVPAKELVQYVWDAEKAGLKDAQIQQNAVQAGWPALDINNTLESVPGPQYSSLLRIGAKDFNAPLGLAVDPLNGNLYVIARALNAHLYMSV
jgi:hypothetical protein